MSITASLGRAERRRRQKFVEIAGDSKDQLMVLWGIHKGVSPYGVRGEIDGARLHI